MTDTPTARCENCKFWGAERAHSYDYPYGTCRALSPHMGKTIALPYHDPDRPSVAGPMIVRGDWPWTAFDDFCGEWQHKPQPAPPSLPEPA